MAKNDRHSPEQSKLGKKMPDNDQRSPLKEKEKTGFEARPHHRVRLPSLSGLDVGKEAATSLPQA